MTDAAPPPLPPEQVDELLSAQLDGELASAAAALGTTAEAARAALAATAGVEERRARLAEARDALAAAPLPAPTRDALVARAMAAAAPDHLAERRAARAGRSRWGRAVTLAGAAAAVALVAGVVASALGGRDAPSDRAERGGTATALAESGGDAGDTGPAGAAEDASGAATLTAPGDTGVDFGAVPGVDELAAAVRERLAAGGDGAGSGPGRAAGSESARPATCPPVDAIAGADTIVLTGTAVMGGEPVEVTVVERAGRRELLVIGTGCALRAQVPLDGGS